MSQKNGARQMGQVKTTLSKGFGTQEGERWVFYTPAKRLPLQDFGPEIGGGRLPQGGPVPRTLP